MGAQQDAACGVIPICSSPAGNERGALLITKYIRIVRRTFLETGKAGEASKIGKNQASQGTHLPHDRATCQISRFPGFQNDGGPSNPLGPLGRGTRLAIANLNPTPYSRRPTQSWKSACRPSSSFQPVVRPPRFQDPDTRSASVGDSRDASKSRPNSLPSGNMLAAYSHDPYTRRRGKQANLPPLQLGALPFSMGEMQGYRELLPAAAVHDQRTAYRALRRTAYSS